MAAVPRRCFGLWLALLAVPAVAAAQDPGFAAKIRVGQTVIVRDVRGAEIRGVVQSVDTTSLAVKYGAGTFPDPSDPAKTLNDTRVFSRADVVVVKKPASIWDGAVKGALVGLIPLGIVAAACDCGAPPPGAYIMVMGISAGVGLGIDAAWGPKTLYRRSEARGSVTVAPVLTRSRRGVAATIRF